MKNKKVVKNLFSKAVVLAIVAIFVGSSFIPTVNSQAENIANGQQPRESEKVEVCAKESINDETFDDLKNLENNDLFNTNDGFLGGRFCQIISRFLNVLGDDSNINSLHEFFEDDNTKNYDIIEKNKLKTDIRINSNKDNFDNNYDFVIISPSIFYEYDGEWDLERLADWHNQNDVLTTYVVPISNIFSNSSFWVNGKWGDVNTDNPFKRIDEDAITNYEMFNDSAAKIRNYIRYAYKDLGVRYALLIGDTDSSGEGYFPVRYVYSQSYGAPAAGLTTYYGIIQTDVYYACLNGTFNADEDFNSASAHTGWGENSTESSEGIEECDWNWDVAVGRFPVDNYDQLNNAIKKFRTRAADLWK